MATYSHVLPPRCKNAERKEIIGSKHTAQTNNIMEKVTLQEFKELAYRAFYWTSFNPDKRGERTILEYENQLNDDLVNMPNEEKERYISNYKKYFSAWLSAHSNCASSAITGGSGFNARRAEKANNREHARYEEFMQWREKALKAIARKVEENKPEAQKRNEAWEYLQKDILHSAAVIHGINTGIERGCSKPLFVSSIYNKVETYAKRGDVEIVKMAIDCIRNFNRTMSVVVTERHKFFKLIEVAEANKERNTDNQNRENSELPFQGGIVVQNWAENRIQLIFDEKPTKEIIDLLKRNAFKWSPRFGAWQRQNTNNAIYAVKTVLQFIKSNVQ
jgi:hypothetical protein